MSTPHLLVIEGPTAVGKTSFAIQLALKHQCPILSADSRQFYKELRIGVARPDTAELEQVPHHFIANISIHDYYSVSKFEQEALNCIETLSDRYPTLVVTGGSGLYVKALLEGIDEMPDPDPVVRQEVLNLLESKGIEALQEELKWRDPLFYQQIDLQNPKRLRRAIEVCRQCQKPYSSLRTQSRKIRPFTYERFALCRDKVTLYQRINERVLQMVQDGLVEEARELLPFRHLNALNTVGYKELFQAFDQTISLEQAIVDIQTHTRRYAKRQLTWLRAQKDVQWIDLDNIN